MTCSTPTRLHLVPALASDVGAQVTLDVTRSDNERRPAHIGRSVAGRVVAPDALVGTTRPSLRLLSERGMVTAEYAVGLIAACAFAGVLLVLIRTGPVIGLLTALINAALKVL